MTMPTEAAMRAAEHMAEYFGMPRQEESIAHLAKMVDRETGLPELIGANQKLFVAAAGEIENRWPHIYRYWCDALARTVAKAK